MFMGEMNGLFTSGTNARSGCGWHCDALFPIDKIKSHPMFFFHSDTSSISKEGDYRNLLTLTVGVQASSKHTFFCVLNS